MIFQIVIATVDHAKAMAPRVRAAEVLEVLASNGMTPEQALIHDLKQSHAAWSWMVDEQVGCMFGIVRPTLLGTECYPWFLSTEIVDKHPREFARTCKNLLPELMLNNPRLIGMVDARYHLSVRWLKWLGAKIDSPKTWGVAGELFHRFQLGD